MFPILLKTSNDLHPSVTFAVSARCNFIDPNREALSKQPISIDFRDPLSTNN